MYGWIPENHVQDRVARPMNDYSSFLKAKTQLDRNDGFEPIEIPDFLFPFQKHAVEWAIRKGRGLLAESCGLGKTPQLLVWADNVARHTNKPVLVLSPLGVAAQTEREAKKFGIAAKVSRDGTIHKPITITNYEQLHRFLSEDFGGGVCDESSCIKAFDGKRRKQIIRFFSKLPYRLLCSATPSPNDFIELGTQSECLGVMTQSDMLGFFFREAKYMRHTVFRDGDFWNYCKWFFKPHSEQPFWKWVSSWCIALQKPSDLGFSDEGFILPPLTYGQHIVETRYIPPGELFPRPANTIHEQQAERQLTIIERCEKVAELIDGHDYAIAWCFLNPEGERLTKIIPGAIEVAGRHSDEHKEDVLNDFAQGNIPVLVTKPKIACWGLNLQICGYMTCFPTYSHEMFHQLVCRCHRYGRVGPVHVDLVSSPGEAHVIQGLDRKVEQEDRMFAALVRYANDAQAMYGDDRHTRELELPEWLNESLEPEKKPVMRDDFDVEVTDESSTSHCMTSRPLHDDIDTPSPNDIHDGVPTGSCRNGKVQEPQPRHQKALEIPSWLS